MHEYCTGQTSKHPYELCEDLKNAIECLRKEVCMIIGKHSSAFTCFQFTLKEDANPTQKDCVHTVHREVHTRKAVNEGFRQLGNRLGYE